MWPARFRSIQDAARVSEVESKKCQKDRCRVKPVFVSFVRSDRATLSLSAKTVVDEAKDDTSLAAKVIRRRQFWLRNNRAHRTDGMDGCLLLSSEEQSRYRKTTTARVAIHFGTDQVAHHVSLVEVVGDEV